MSAASPPRWARGTKGAGMTFTEFMDRAAQAFEVVAVAVLIVGMVWSLPYSGWVWRTPAMGAARLLLGVGSRSITNDSRIHLVRLAGGPNPSGHAADPTRLRRDPPPP
jgi:hypothetical protein